MKVLRWLNRNLELAVSAVMLVAMVFCVTVQVISRYIFPSPAAWTEEATRYLFVWMVFASIGVCAKRGKHIRITILQAKLPKRAAPFLNLFSDLCFLVVAAACGYYGLEIVSTIRDAGQASSSMPWLYKWYVYLIVPIGFALAVFRLVQDMVGNIRQIARRQDLQEEAKL